MANTLHSLDVNGSGTVVVQDNILVNSDASADVRISVRGSGNVLATTQSDLHVKSLTIDLSGSGDVQFVTPSITVVDAATARITSSGELRVFTSAMTAPHITLSASNSGSVQLAALSFEASKTLDISISGSGSITTIGSELKAGLIDTSITGTGSSMLVAMNAFTANNVAATVAGSGDVKIASTHAQCDETKISIAGSGSVDARDLVAKQAGVRISGSGRALFRASEVADTSVDGSGLAMIVGELPPRVTGKRKVYTEIEKPSLVEKLGSKCHTPADEPSRADAFAQFTDFTGSYNVTSFSEFLTAVKAMWCRKGHEVVFEAGSAASEP